MKPVEVKNLSLAIDGTVILDDITIDVNDGEFVGLIGPNGGGKTTLLQVLVGVVRGWTGEVRVFGRSPRDLGPSRHLIAYVAQQASQASDFPATALDVVLMGRVAVRGLVRRLGLDDRARARAMLDAVGMSEHADRPVGDLSGGQRQRALIARALVASPRLLILDEPMTGVDRGAEESFFDLLAKLKREMDLTIIMASHDLTMVSRHCGMVACINRQMHCHSRPEELDYQKLADQFGRHVELFIHGNVPHRVVSRHEDDEAAAPACPGIVCPQVPPDAEATGGADTGENGGQP